MWDDVLWFCSITQFIGNMHFNTTLYIFLFSVRFKDGLFYVIIMFIIVVFVESSWLMYNSV